MIDDMTIPVPPVEPKRDTPITPFVIVLERLDEKPNGSFRPGAFVRLSPMLRTSGLLAALSPELAKLVLGMVTFLTPNGDCTPTLPELADALHVLPLLLRPQLTRLTAFRFAGKPIVYEVARGVHPAYMLAPEVLSFAQQPATPQAPPMTIQAASREEVIDYSRTHYARPRLEVERSIAQEMNWEPLQEDASPETKERQTVYQRLLAIGIEKDEATSLLLRFPLEAIHRQIEWLPYRHAKSRSRYLIAAIEGDYQPPRIVKQPASEQEVSAQHEEDTAQSEEVVPNSL